MECYLAIKSNRVSIHAIIRMNLKVVMLSKKSRQKSIKYIIQLKHFKKAG